MTMETPRGPESTVVRMVANAMHVQNIEVETGWTRDQIMAVAIRDGYALDAATHRFRRAPKPKPTPVGVVRTPETSTGAADTGLLTSDPTHDRGTNRERGGEPSPSAPVLTAHSDLITEGKASSLARVRAAAARAETALHVLADLLDETRAAEAEKAAVEAEKAKARAEVARLEKQLRDAKASLKASLKGGRKDAGPSLEAKVVRAWAAEQGVDCPPVGRVPRGVMDAYREAVAS